MTPEEAKNLIDGIDPRNEYHMWADFQRRYDPHTVYDALETIAGLRYEYAVQVTDKDGSVLYAKSYRTLSGDIEEAWWQDEPNEKLAEKWWSKIPACRVRILRRLVADEEVMG